MSFISRRCSQPWNEKSEATETVFAARIPRGRLLFTTQIPENLPANFRVFFVKKVGSTVEIESITALTIAPNSPPLAGFGVLCYYHKSGSTDSASSPQSHPNPLLRHSFRSEARPTRLSSNTKTDYSSVPVRTGLCRAPFLKRNFGYAFNTLGGK